LQHWAHKAQDEDKQKQNNTTPYVLDTNMRKQTQQKQSRENDNIGYTKRRQRKQKHNTPCDGHHYAQANTNDSNKICVRLQTTGGKDEPEIVFTRKS
jgi:hypothetical protein